MRVRVTTSNTTTTASIEANKARGDRVIATSGGIALINTGAGLTGGPITTSGTISANAANTTQSGIVQLNDTLTSNSITQAATANVANSLSNIANTKLDIIGGTITGSLNVSGNLIVSGNTITLNVETLVVEDNEVVLSSGVSGAPSLNAGIIVNRGNQNNVFVRWNETTDKWGWSDVDQNFYAFDTALDAYNTANNALSVATTANTVALIANTIANLAFNQANSAYDAANNAAVRVTANTGSTISANVISFNNTSTIAVTVTGAGSNANVSFNTTNAFHKIFVSDGTTNTYSLPTTVSNVNNILVSIDGVIIIPTQDYTTSGSALTLTFMPPNGLNIEARALR